MEAIKIAADEQPEKEEPAAMSFEDAVRSFGDTVTRVCIVHLFDRTLAEDCWQETFLALYKTPKVLRRGREAVRAWLVRVAMNKCADENRRHHLTVPLTEEEAARDEYPFELLSALDRLPENNRQCLYLFYYERYSVAEIAKIVGKPEGTVKTLLRRGRELLKGEISGDEMG